MTRAKLSVKYSLIALALENGVSVLHKFMEVREFANVALHVVHSISVLVVCTFLKWDLDLFYSS